MELTWDTAWPWSDSDGRQLSNEYGWESLELLLGSYRVFTRDMRREYYWGDEVPSVLLNVVVVKVLLGRVSAFVCAPAKREWTRFNGGGQSRVVGLCDS